MKITSVTTKIVNAELRNWIFVRVETDVPGLYGWGEATLEWKTRAVVFRDLATKNEALFGGPRRGIKPSSSPHRQPELDL
jgi:L-alanine-DL-glutamate epimerase-like enolase superfamily enzyme